MVLALSFELLELAPFPLLPEMDPKQTPHEEHTQAGQAVYQNVAKPNVNHSKKYDQAIILGHPGSNRNPSSERLLRLVPFRIGLIFFKPSRPRHRPGPSELTLNCVSLSNPGKGISVEGNREPF